MHGEIRREGERKKLAISDTQTAALKINQLVNIERERDFRASC